MEAPKKKEMWPVLLTPFTPEGAVDYDALSRLIDWYEENGASGLFAVCQSSEVFYLSLAERISIASFIKRRARIPVIASGHVSYALDDQLDELRRVNDAIPDEEMTDKISRLEAVSAKIFEQARTDPDKLPQMRKFMDYYLPTSLKLLNTYAELDKQGIEGENISESKHRIEQTMDTLVKAFENQLDRLFASDALDVSTDIDVMQNMLRADGLTDDAPFKL